MLEFFCVFFFQAEDGIRDLTVTGVQTCALPISGAVPEQQFSTLIPYMMQTYGKKVYTLAADYNFGQISAEWVRKIVKENGGEMAGEEIGRASCRERGWGGGGGGGGERVERRVAA